MLQIMVDLETMGCTAGSSILSIGACAFDPEENWVPDIPECRSLDAVNNQSGLFHVNISLEDCQSHGLTIEAQTVNWWLKQTENSREYLTINPQSLKEALCRFQQFCFNLKSASDIPANIWGHGASFDQVLLGAAYKATGLVQPWNQYTTRDTRTLLALVYPELGGRIPDEVWPNEVRGLKHVAWADAWVQAIAINNCYKRIQIKNAST